MESDADRSGRVSAVDRLVEQIRALIAARGLGIGDPLPTERDLGELLNAGRNTVREAMQILRAYGVIETRPKVGAVISGGQGEALRRLFALHNDVSPESFRDLQAFRKILEIGIADHIIPRATEADFTRLHRINDLILDAATVDGSARADFTFHEALFELAGNQTALATYRMLGAVIEHVMRVGKADRMVNTATHVAHAEIIEALRARDRIAHTYLMSRHLDYGLRFVGAFPQPESRSETGADAAPLQS